ncbi:MAG: hypothetical protein R6U64_02570, partial [Bacteroidales bacterium]
MERDAHVAGEVLDGVAIGLHEAGEPDAGKNRGFERGRRLQRIDFQRIEGGESFVACVPPQQFS